jgi:hypothetical protein
MMLSNVMLTGAPQARPVQLKLEGATLRDGRRQGQCRQKQTPRQA